MGAEPDPYRQHVYPLGDVREHVTNGDPCPCLPRTVEGVVIHNSYDGRETGEVCRQALDLLGVALAEHSHTWSDREREAYEHAITVLDMHWPSKG